MPIGESFPAVLQAARLGADWAWTAIYRDLAPAVHGYLALHGAAEPQDLTGEVFLHVVRGLHGFEGDESRFRSWVFMIAHHRLVDERRARSRKPCDPVSSDALIVHAGEGSVEEEALDSLSSDTVRRVLAELSPDQQDVLLLRIVGGLTVEEVAKAVGKRPGAVKALQRRGLAAIKRKVSRQVVSL
ncbi:MAG: sigma-70 family RNA polymerase sigma factor [Actinomycetota bacterium]|nr:sigma-70 family RNA polymerase sigma factor [Actinomycetota bacterium]